MYCHISYVQTDAEKTKTLRHPLLRKALDRLNSFHLPVETRHRPRFVSAQVTLGTRCELAINALKHRVLRHISACERRRDGGGCCTDCGS